MLSIRSTFLCALCVGAAIVLSPTPASAHFFLNAPASWSVDSMTNGAPEKLGPCGNEGNPVAAKDDAGQPLITAFQEGQMITVTITEVVFHPGHYRIALSLGPGDTVQTDFPADPTVTPGPTNSGMMVCPRPMTTVCGSVPLVSQTPSQTPQGWILADNAFEHCMAFSGPQSIKVALPPGVTCKECVLQVLEFMSDHPLNPQGGCFYHHCANISIQGSGNGSSDASAPSDAAMGADVASSGSVSSGSVVSSGTFVSSGSAVSGVSSGSASSTGASVSSGSAASGIAGGGMSGASSSGTGSGSATNGGSPAPSNSSGCSVSALGASSSSGLAGLGLAVCLFFRRRRSRA